jgi:pyruvate, orthophosphate dikinase
VIIVARIGIQPFFTDSKNRISHNSKEECSMNDTTSTGDASVTYVYSFEDGHGLGKQLLGGKGYGLCDMTKIGVNVPPGFVVTTRACQVFFENSNLLPQEITRQIVEAMIALESKTGKVFGGADNPLLVSVRSGAAVSMPGMMDTILNLGLNASAIKGLIAQTNNPRFAYDAYRRFLQLFGKVALGVPDAHFDACMTAKKKSLHVSTDTELTVEALQDITRAFITIIEQHTGEAFPEDPWKQLHLAVVAVFQSWNGKRAVDYRREFNITPAIAQGTAVNVVSMVFGNMGDDSGTGVGFTRNPGTGVNEPYGEYMVNAQGEDVVAGIRTPETLQSLENTFPSMYNQILALRQKLEGYYREVQDYEFTVEKGVLYCLQTRTAKMNGAARVKTAVDLHREGVISEKEMIMRVKPSDIEHMLSPQLASNHTGTVVVQGLPASPGAATGAAVFHPDVAEVQGRAGIPVILIREETKPEDIHGFFPSQGILTSRGGKTSHAAVVARGMGKPCVSGATEMNVEGTVAYLPDGRVIREGDCITIDGNTGDVYLESLPLVDASFTEELEFLLRVADTMSAFPVYANADTPEDARKAVEYGARGIGLCRTERMFNDPARLPTVRSMILAEQVEDRQRYLDILFPMQVDDFIGIFTAMAGKVVTVRLLDPPMHEFLPTHMKLHEDITVLLHTIEMSDNRIDLETLAQELIELKTLQRRSEALAEVNPMLGHRGVRLGGMTYPEIYRMQIRAIMEATVTCLQNGIEVYPQIMVPQVCMATELQVVKQMFVELRATIERRESMVLPVEFGTMLETVRACIQSASIAPEVDFYSFGTNDLTQATFSFSREDAENRFIPHYQAQGAMEQNPFEVLDEEGVGFLMKHAITAARHVYPDLPIGICGEHGGYPDSFPFFKRIGLSKVSCSVSRVPVARLAAAHASVFDS